MNFTALVVIEKDSLYKNILNVNLDRFDEPFSPIVVPHELSVVKQLPTVRPLRRTMFLTMGYSRAAALRISLFADFSIGDNLVESSISSDLLQSHYSKLRYLGKL